jgi:hypothetical protein
VSRIYNVTVVDGVRILTPTGFGYAPIRIEASDFTKDLWEELAHVTSEAHALAPWRPELRRVEGIPCPECHNCALVIFGGEEDVSCLECRLIIPKERYLIWTRIAAAEWGELA